MIIVSFDQDIINQDIIDQDIINQDIINQDIIDQDITDQDTIDQDIIDQDITDQDIIDQDMISFVNQDMKYQDTKEKAATLHVHACPSSQFLPVLSPGHIPFHFPPRARDQSE